MTKNGTAMEDVGRLVSRREYNEALFFSFWRRKDAPELSLANLAATKISDTFDDAKTLVASLQHILPRSVLETVRAEHRRNCVEVWLKYDYHDMKLHCLVCTPRPPWDPWEEEPYHSDFESQDPSIRNLGPMQISNLYKLKDRYTCCVCELIPFFRIVPHCRCDIVGDVNADALL